MNQFLSTSEKAARVAGDVLRQWRGRFDVREKGPADLVTDADLAAQEAIRDVVLSAFPDHEFLGEESDLDKEKPASEGDSEAYRWIVDPLDGTTNYVHGLPMYCVSVALTRGEKILAGTIYDPNLEECFTAAAGEGAFLNGKRMKTSDVRQADQALVSASFSTRVRRDGPELARFIEAVLTCQAIRRSGSAALNLAYVAAGRLDVYWGSAAKVWDVAAGLLLIQEAGGVINSFDGSSVDLYHPEFVTSATPELQREMLELLTLQ